MNPRHVTEVVDRLLLEQGELHLLECLIGLGLLDRTDYENWRKGRRVGEFGGVYSIVQTARRSNEI